MMLVSRRTLPAFRLNLFAALLDGKRHHLEILWINATYEAHKALARRSGGCRQATSEIENLLLLGRVQAVNLLNDLVFNSLSHNKINLGKGTGNVKNPLAEMGIAEGGSTR